MDGEPVDPDEPPTPTFADGLADHLVIEAVRASSRAGGRWVDVG